MEDMSMDDKYYYATLRALTEGHADFKTVDLSGHDFSCERFADLAEHIASSKTIHTLELFGIKSLSPDSWKKMSESFPEQLNSLDLGKCELGANGGASAKHVFGNLHRLTNLEDLNLSGNEIDESHNLPVLCDALSKMHNLGELMVQNNKLKSEGAVKVAGCLKSSVNLHTLWLQSNNVSDEGKQRIRESLKHVTSLTRLELGSS